ncbi:MAG: MATE family efflux transporter [Candidatus Riflebacteria bacterium]|nr:MATE family efflux transporter [Candidatus Riflebacteria bacterium]
MSVLVQGSVKRTLFRTAFPMLAGTFAMNAYHLADTWFVARLGTLSLAAMGFTFPVVMLLTFVAGGIGTGVTTLTSHALGRQDRAAASRLVSHGFALSMLIAGLMALVGYHTITPVFSALGADARTLPLIGDYMRTWYAGAATMTLPMLGNGILIALGDSRAASQFIMIGTLLNLVLDPIMIFGWLGCPAWGIFGASLATVISQGVGTAWLFHLLIVKHRLLAFRPAEIALIPESWRNIMRFAVPAVISMMLMPISSAVITGLVSRFGTEAVAACGAASRLEMVAFVIPMALGISLTPFISQNFGAGRLDRIREAKSLAMRFALAYGLGNAVLFFLAARHLAGFFTDDPAVTGILVSYVRIIAWGYGMMEVHRYCGFIMTGLQRPAAATTLNGIRVLVLLLPLSFLGAWLGGIRGIFWGRLATDLAVGSIGLAWVTRLLATHPGISGPVGQPAGAGMAAPAARAAATLDPNGRQLPPANVPPAPTVNPSAPPTPTDGQSASSPERKP